MVPFVVFVTVAGASVLAHWLNDRRAHRPFHARDMTQRSLAYALAAMLLVAASGHFVDYLRSGLIAVVPPFIPHPDLVITVTGFFEVTLAVGVIVPATRKLVAWVLVAYLIAVFPANVLAATSVDHPDAPSTPLLLRDVIQFVFIASAVFIALTAQGMSMRTVIDKWRSRGSVGVPQPASPARHVLPTDKAPAKQQGTAGPARERMVHRRNAIRSAKRSRTWTAERRKARLSSPMDDRSAHLRDPRAMHDFAEDVPAHTRKALVFGATGFIGRFLVRALLQKGISTTAAVRDIGRFEALTAWLRVHEVDTTKLGFVEVDLTVDGIGLPTGSLDQISEIYNVAGAYAFGMTPDAARAANVDTSRRVVEFAATLPHLGRLVHLSGYRVGGQDPRSVPWAEANRLDRYSRLGAYEASKVESDAIVQASAQRLGVPLTIANPSTVIGDSATGESDQLIGLATTVRHLLAGELPAVPGSSATFVPVVTVDYLATFLTLLPATDAARGESYWVLDDETPALADLLRLIGHHHKVNVPRLRIPVNVIKRLPVSITRADPETLSFLTSDRYPTAPAEALARSHGLKHPDVSVALTNWSDYLARRHFGHPTG